MGLDMREKAGRVQRVGRAAQGAQRRGRADWAGLHKHEGQSSLKQSQASRVWEELETGAQKMLCQLTTAVPLSRGLAFPGFSYSWSTCLEAGDPPSDVSQKVSSSRS